MLPERIHRCSTCSCSFMQTAGTHPCDYGLMTHNTEFVRRWCCWVYARNLSLLISNFHPVWVLYSLFWVMPRRLDFMCRRYGKLSVPSSRRLNFIWRRFEKLFHLPGVWTLYDDVSGNSVPSSRRLNFIWWRLEKLCLFHLLGVWILCADVSKHCLFHLHSCTTYEDGTDGVPKRRRIKFRTPGESS
jgi:hypothetical protein